MFTRDARDAYDYFARGIDPDTLSGLPWHRRLLAQSRLSPARRALFGVAMLCALIGLFELFSGFGLTSVPLIPFVLNISVPGPAWSDGTFWLFGGFALVNLLVAYSDGMTEAENRAGQPFDEDGLERAIHAYGSSPAPDLARTLFTIVEQHAGDMKMVDDLTIVVVKRTDAIPPPVPADR